MIRLRRAATVVVTCLLLPWGAAPIAFAEEPAPVAPASADVTGSSTAPTAEPTDPEPAPSTSDPVATSGPTLSGEPAPTPTAAPPPALAPLAVASPASTGFAYVIHTGGVCDGATADPITSFNSGTGAVVVDLSKVPGGNTAVTFDSDAAAGCLAEITSLSFTGDPGEVTEIQIGQAAFAQTASGVPNRLTTVTFPEGITELWVGKSAFAQFSDTGSNALGTVTFPASLSSLLVDDYAFRQETTDTGADNALAAADFPAGLPSLTLGVGSFVQVSDHGNNALASVTFPSAPTEAFLISASAFQQTAGGDNALAAVSLPSGISEIQIGADAFAQTADNDNALASLTLPDSLTSLSVSDGAFAQTAGGHNALTSLTFPASMTFLDLGISAFTQQTTGDADTALASVTFPTTVGMLVTGDYGFAQTSAGGDATLQTIHFPTDAGDGIGLAVEVFAQTAPTGHTALASVKLPASAQMMFIAPRAFAQTSTSNTLTTVVFPATLSALYVGTDAFAESDTSVLSELIFPFSSAPTAGTRIDTAGIPTSGIDWVWFGPDAARVTDWPTLFVGSVPLSHLLPAARLAPQGAAPQPVLNGYRTLTLRNVDVTTTHYVYRDGQSPTSPLSGQSATVGAANANGGWTTTLPTAARAGVTFAGWCATETSPSGHCSGATFAAGATYTLSANASLWAMWTSTSLQPPQIPSQDLGGSQAGQSFSHVIAVSGEGPITCAITAGTLPPGVGLNDCTLSGTPTTPGTYTFTVTATNSGGSTDREFTLTVAAAETVTDPDVPLADTGSGDLTPTVWVAALLIAIGGGLRWRRSAR